MFTPCKPPTAGEAHIRSAKTADFLSIIGGFGQSKDLSSPAYGKTLATADCGHLGHQEKRVESSLLSARRAHSAQCAPYGTAGGGGRGIGRCLGGNLGVPQRRLMRGQPSNLTPWGMPHDCLPKGAFSHSAGTVRAQRGHSANYYADYPGNNPENHLRNHAQSVQNSKIQTSDACHGSQGPKFCPL